MPVISAMMNAPAPITGGMIIAPVEAAPSTAAAMCGGKPVFFMSGIVTVPVVTVSAIGLPLTMPMKRLEITAAWAGPPAMRPSAARDRSTKNRATPATSMKAPNTTKGRMKPATTSAITPKMPSELR